MTIELSDGATTVNLHPDTFWSDESSWHPVEQALQRTITGALVVSVAARVAGRPITLQSIDENSAWIQRPAVELLRNWAAVPGKVLNLSLNGQTFEVIFRHHEPPAFDATHVKFQREAESSDWFTVALRLMTI